MENYGDDKMKNTYSYADVCVLNWDIIDGWSHNGAFNCDCKFTIMDEEIRNKKRGKLT